MTRSLSRSIPNFAPRCLPAGARNSLRTPLLQSRKDKSYGTKSLAFLPSGWKTAHFLRCLLNIPISQGGFPFQLSLHHTFAAYFPALRASWSSSHCSLWPFKRSYLPCQVRWASKAWPIGGQWLLFPSPPPLAACGGKLVLWDDRESAEENH